MYSPCSQPFVSTAVWIMKACGFGLLLATVGATGPQWLLTSQYRPAGSKGCGASGPVASWNAKVTFGACLYDGNGPYAILTLASDGQSVSVQEYSDSSCTSKTGTPTSMTLASMGIKMGCSSSFYGGANVETFTSLAADQYTSTSPYGLPLAPFAGVGYYFTTSSTCSDFSAITEISLSNAGQGSGFCYYPGGSAPGDASYTISCADPSSPSLILFPLPNCGGTGFPMTPSNYPNYQKVLANIQSPPCKLKGDSYFQQVFCYNTAVATPSRMLYPTPAPTPPPHPTAPPTKLPTAAPTPTPAPTQTVRLTDKAALCALYSSFDFAKRTALLPSWTCSSSALACSSSSASTSTWAGVTCTRGRVTSVTLSGLKLGSGSLPSSIGTMDGLTSLTLSGLGLSGYLPAQLGLLTSLVTLSASANSLSGWLPSTLGLLRGLKTLDLHSNNFDGSVPTTLGGLSQLTSLDLGNCKIAGAIPTYLGAMTNLRILNLGGNLLAGTVPSSVCSLAKASVSVSGNLGIPCYPACLASQPGFSHDSQQVQCSPPTSAPTLRVVTAAPTSSPTPSAMLGQSASSSSAEQDGAGSGVSTGAIVGISVALAVLCVAALFVYRAVKRSELDLPNEKDDQNLSLARNPMEGSERGNARGGYGRNDSIPPEMPGLGGRGGRSGGSSLSVGAGEGGGRRRDTIPIGDGYSAKFGGGRLDPNQL